MSRKDKQLARLREGPRDYTWDEAVAVLSACGFELENRSGSRRAFVHYSGRKLIMHRPHPDPRLKRYQVLDVIEALRDVGEL